MQILNKYLELPNLYIFNDSDRSITFLTERLIPKNFSGKPRVMLLFSNPHPFSVYQGMFLSPNTRRKRSLFWSIMNDASLIKISGEHPEPHQLADICFKLRYESPFDFLFYCYYSFPTDFPDDIERIFGTDYFRKVVEPETEREFIEILRENDVGKVITFNKGIFNLISKDTVEHYVGQLMQGKIIESKIRGIDRDIPVFLTYPTGWRYHKDYEQLRISNLTAIRAIICRTG
jgi:hypothetical protein